MGYKPTYNILYEILTSNKGKANKDCNFTNIKENENIYFEYILKNGYLIEAKDEKIHFIGQYDLSNKSKIFIDKYETNLGEIEYFFKDYPFLGSIIVGFFGGMGATILNILFTNI